MKKLLMPLCAFAAVVAQADSGGDGAETNVCVSFATESGWQSDAALWLDPCRTDLIGGLGSQIRKQSVTYQDAYRTAYDDDMLPLNTKRSGMLLIEYIRDCREGRAYAGYNGRLYYNNGISRQVQVYMISNPNGPNGCSFFDASLNSYTTTEKIFVDEVGPGTTPYKQGMVDVRRIPFSPEISGARTVIMAYGSQNGGGTEIIGTKGKVLLREDGLDNPIVANGDFDAWVDGEKVDLTQTRFNGGWQIISVRLPGTTLCGLGYSDGTDRNCGNQYWGDVLVFTNELADVERVAAEKALAAKWGVVYKGKDLPIRYIDADGVEKTRSGGEYDGVTAETRFLTNGWYAVTNDVDIAARTNIVVQGDVHLILCDGASLTVTNVPVNAAAVSVAGGASLTIYGQGGNTGRLEVRCGANADGIGGMADDECGAIAIHGGAIDASSIQDDVKISGGVFARPIKIEWIAEGYAIGGNSDLATSAVYPYAVMPSVFEVLISDIQHSTVQWTYGDGAVTNLVTDRSFNLGTGMTGVRVIFTPKLGYRFRDQSETGVRTLPSPVAYDCYIEAPELVEIYGEVTFVIGEGIKRAEYILEGASYEIYGKESMALRLGTSIELIVEVLPRYYPYAGVRKFTVDENETLVEIFASLIPKGAEGNPFQIGADVFASTNAAGVMSITGTGAMSNFVSAADVPWEPATVKTVTIGAEVTQIGANAWSGMDDSVAINGTALSTVMYLAPGVASAQSSAGAISPAEFERIDIVDGKALLDVSVWTNASLEVEKAGGGGDGGWGVATNGVIEVPAPGKQGFFILKSKGVSSDAVHAPIFIPEIVGE